MILSSGWTARAGARRGRRLARRQESGITVRYVDFRMITLPPFASSEYGGANIAGLIKTHGGLLGSPVTRVGALAGNWEMTSRSGPQKVLKLP